MRYGGHPSIPTSTVPSFFHVAYSSILKMEAAGSPKTLATTYRSIWCHITEDCYLPLWCHITCAFEIASLNKFRSLIIWPQLNSKRFHRACYTAFLGRAWDCISFSCMFSLCKMGSSTPFISFQKHILKFGSWESILNLLRRCHILVQTCQMENPMNAEPNFIKFLKNGSLYKIICTLLIIPPVFIKVNC
jgi:hypothetical protein